MTNESLKLDMTQPENRYALIVRYFENNQNRLGDNHPKNSKYVRDAIDEACVQLTGKTYESLTKSRHFVLGEIMPIRLLRSERSTQ